MSSSYSESASGVISRLVGLVTTLKTILVAFGVLVFGVLFMTAAMMFDRSYWWLGAILGVALGYGFGIYLASMLSLFVDWMVQVLSNRP